MYITLMYTKLYYRLYTLWLLTLDAALMIDVSGLDFLLAVPLNTTFAFLFVLKSVWMEQQFKVGLKSWVFH